MLLHVIDLSNPEWETQARIVDDLIVQLGAEATPRLRVFNKCDRFLGVLPHGQDTVCISALSGEGTQTLLDRLSELLGSQRQQLRLFIPYARAAALDMLKREAVVKKTEYTDTGIAVEATVPDAIAGKLREFIPDRGEQKE